MHQAPPTAPEAPAPPGPSAEPAEPAEPLATGDPDDAVEDKLESYLQRVLLPRDPAEQPARSVELVQARRFEEGHVNEAWYLAVDVDGQLEHAVLKVFPDAEAAARNARFFAAAHEHGWPVPTELVRGTALPYSERPSVLMEYIVGGSLQTHIVELHRASGGAPPPGEIAARYAEVAEMLAAIQDQE